MTQKGPKLLPNCKKKKTKQKQNKSCNLLSISQAASWFTEGDVRPFQIRQLLRTVPTLPKEQRERETSWRKVELWSKLLPATDGDVRWIDSTVLFHFCFPGWGNQFTGYFLLKTAVVGTSVRQSTFHHFFRPAHSDSDDSQSPFFFHSEVAENSSVTPPVTPCILHVHKHEPMVHKWIYYCNSLIYSTPQIPFTCGSSIVLASTEATISKWWYDVFVTK